MLRSLVGSEMCIRDSNMTLDNSSNNLTNGTDSERLKECFTQDIKLRKSKDKTKRSKSRKSNENHRLEDELNTSIEECRKNFLTASFNLQADRSNGYVKRDSDGVEEEKSPKVPNKPTVLEGFNDLYIFIFIFNYIDIYLLLYIFIYIYKYILSN